MVLPSYLMPVASSKDFNVREMESPLDVLSRAASLIQQEEARSKIDGEKDGSSDSGFEDNPSPPSKVSIHEERRDARMRERQSLTSALNKNEEKELIEKSRDEDDRRSPVYLAMKENNALVKSKTRVVETVEKSNDKNEDKPKIGEGVDKPTQKGVNSDHANRRSVRSGSPLENETRESVIKTPVTAPGLSKFTASSLKPVGHYGFPLLPPFGSTLPMMSRPSVITTAGCPNVFKGPNFPCCQCMQSSCCPDVKAVFPERHHHNRELHSAIPSGFESPTVDDHFKKSLGAVYDRLSPGGHHYEMKAPSPHLQSRSTGFKEAGKPRLPASLSRHVDLIDHNKGDMLHPLPLKSERDFRDYSSASFHKRRHFHYDPIAHYTQERMHGYVSPMQAYEANGLTKEHLFMPHAVEEPVTVDDHFAKALGKLWFDVQVRNSEQVMRFHSKSLRVAHQ